MKEEFYVMKHHNSDQIGPDMYPSYAAIANNTMGSSVRKKTTFVNNSNTAQDISRHNIHDFNTYTRNAEYPPVFSHQAKSSPLKMTSNPENVATHTTSKNKEHNTNSKNLLICWDSNRKHIETRRLCSLNTTDFVATPMLNDVYRAIENSTHTQLKTILIHCGTNDAEQKDVHEIINAYKHILNLISRKYANTTVIISQLLPRKDILNNKIIDINQSLNNEFSNNDKINIIFHKNINSRFESENTDASNAASILRDNKHLSQTAAAMFAGNLKYALRRANILPGKNEIQYDKNKPANSPNITANQNKEPIFSSQSLHPNSNTNKQTSKKTLFCEAMMEVFDRIF